jgi:hypothetical protein
MNYAEVINKLCKAYSLLRDGEDETALDYIRETLVNAASQGHTEAQITLDDYPLDEDEDEDDDNDNPLYTEHRQLKADWSALVDQRKRDKHESEE